jgi:arylsulfatase A-like enzyme
MSAAAFAVRQVAFTVALLVIVAVAGDLGAASSVAGKLGTGGLLRVALASAAWAVVVGAAASSALIVVGFLASRLGRDVRPRILLGAAAAVAPVVLAVVLLGLDLLSGPRISAKPWAGAVKAAWVAGVPLAGVALSWIAARSLWIGDLWPRRRGLLLALALTFIPIALVLDQKVYPVLYLSGHLLLWVGIFCAVSLHALFANRAAPLRATRGAAVFLCAALIGAGAILSWGPLAEAPLARAAGYRETLFLKRALAHLAPVPKAEPLDPDPAIVSALSSAKRLDAALLDRALPGRRKMNVVVVSIDAVRADRVSRAYPRKLTPNLDALLSGACTFRNAWTSYPFTIMAFASVFSGVYASATDAHRYRELGLDRDPWNQPTVAKIMKRHGWRTEAIVGFPRYVREPLEREAGFDLFNADMDPGAKDRDLVASEIATLGIDALDREPGRPFLLWLHFFDPHAPYDPPPPHPWGDARADLYDAEIQYADRELGRFLGALRARRLDENTAIVLFSDHGEDLHEFDHGTALTEEQVHVPLAIALPRIPGREIALAVDLSDVAPTILELVGLDKEASMHGQSLLPCALLDPKSTPPDAFPPDLAFTELGCKGLPHPRQVAARAGSLKIIYHADSQTYALYDLASDPGEKRDLSESSPDALARMKRVLDSFRALAAAEANRPDSRPATRVAPK